MRRSFFAAFRVVCSFDIIWLVLARVISLAASLVEDSSSVALANRLDSVPFTDECRNSENGSLALYFCACKCSHVLYLISCVIVVPATLGYFFSGFLSSRAIGVIVMHLLAANLLVLKQFQSLFMFLLTPIYSPREDFDLYCCFFIGFRSILQS